MKYGVYVIRDIKSTFMTPTVDINDNLAIRNFAHAVTRSEGVINSHKQDFQLFKIAVYDNDTGYIEKFDAIKLLAEGSDFE